jgi:hypothetical protein
MRVISVIRKPGLGSTTDTVLTWHTGVVNIDATRISSDSLPKACVGTGWASQDKKNEELGYRETAYYADQTGFTYAPSQLGRWPANLILGVNLPSLPSAGNNWKKNYGREYKGRQYKGGVFGGGGYNNNTYCDTGSASRFFKKVTK